MCEEGAALQQVMVFKEMGWSGVGLICSQLHPVQVRSRTTALGVPHAGLGDPEHDKSACPTTLHKAEDLVQASRDK